MDVKDQDKDGLLEQSCLGSVAADEISHLLLVNEVLLERFSVPCSQTPCGV